MHPLAVLVAVAAHVAVAGSVTGRVVDAGGAPVAGASVALIELGRGTLTGRDGAFSIAGVAPGRYTIQVRRLGFAPLTRRVDIGNGTLSLGDLSVVEAAFRAEAVTVTASRGAGDLLATPLSTASLAEEQVRRANSVAIARVADRIAGVRSVTTGGQTAKPVIRGLSGPRVLVLDDGHRLEDYSWSDEDGPSIDARFAERIEVVRGAASLLYGSDALGGVLNAIPAALPDAVGRDAYRRIGAELSAASNNMELSGALRGEGARGRTGWRAFGIGRFAEDLHTPSGKIEHTGFGAFNGEIAGGIRHASGTSSLRFAHYGGEFKLLEADATGAAIGTGSKEEEEGPDRVLIDDRLQYAGSYALGGARLATRAQWQRHDIAEKSDDLARFSFPGVTIPPGGGKDQTVFDLLLNTGTAEAVLHAQSAPWLESTVGVSGIAQISDSKGPVFLVPDATTVGGAAFAVERATAGRLTVLAGGRVDGRRLSADPNAQLSLGEQRRHWTAGSGDVGAVVRLTDALAVTGNIGLAWRAPTLFELFANGPRLGEARYEIGRADLSAERGLDVDGSLRWQSPHALAEATIFRNRIDDYIYVAPTAQQQQGFPVYRYGQADAVLTGGEVSAEVHPTSLFALRGRYDMVRGTNEGTHDPLPQIPAARGAGEIEFHGARLGAFAQPHAGLEIERVARASRVAPNETPAAAYTLVNLDLGAEHMLGARVVRIDLGVRNLGDTRYRDFLSRYRLFADDPGRNIVLRLSTGL